jgi:alkylation response protein AidB-like acyl-CoA dehydrogenase
MDFTLSPEQQAVQKKAQRLAREVKDLSTRLDREAQFPREILHLWGQEGMFGLALPKEYGGQGLNSVAYALAQMELAQACPASALILHVNHTLFGGSVAQFGTAAQKEACLPQVARGEVLACFALTEPEAGSDPAGMKSAARRDQAGWVLTGGKNFVTSGGEARFALVAAVTEPGQGAKGISAFVVDIPATPEITWGSREEKLGLRAAASVPLFFDEAHLPETSLLGEKNKGLTVMLSALDAARVGSAAIAVGLGRAALAEAMAYAKKRQQFGQPVAHFQAIQ